LAQAQKAKHQMVLAGLRFKPGQRILDVGAGLGPFLAAVKAAGGEALGLTLSSEQVKYCAERGLDNRLLDWKEAGTSLGHFDGIASIGSFEHYCSVEEYRQGKQEDIYRSFFKFCAEALPLNGRLYLQTMIWGKHTPDPEKMSLKAPKGSLYHRLARLEKFYPGSWLPLSLEQIIDCAKPYFELVSNHDGRKDYIRTLDAWGEASRANFWRREKLLTTLWQMTKLLPRYAIF
jgi:cyclopropane-fatty-acyl-phospholipid synthase